MAHKTLGWVPLVPGLQPWALGCHVQQFCCGSMAGCRSAWERCLLAQSLPWQTLPRSSSACGDTYFGGPHPCLRQHQVTER